MERQERGRRGERIRCAVDVAGLAHETLARRIWPGEDPLGRRVTAVQIPELQDMTVVGVVGDTRRGGALTGYTPEMYVPFAQFPQSGATLVVRATDGVDPLTLAPDMRTAVSAVDPSTAIRTVTRVSDALGEVHAPLATEKADAYYFARRGDNFVVLSPEE